MRWIALTYHDVPESEDGVGHFATPRARFARQLDLARAMGVELTTLEAAVGRAESRSVALTFDDGDQTHYTCAFPELVSRAMRASFFVITDRVGTAGYVTWAQLREMAAAGMSIGSHTASHAFLSTLSAARLRDELARSKGALDDALGQSTSTLALPGGDEPVRALWPLVHEAGFTLVATSRPGANGRALPTTPGGARLVRRLTVRHGQPEAHFPRQLRQDARVVLAARLRFALLEGLRGAVGRGRYARWRRSLLDRHPGAARVLGS